MNKKQQAIADLLRKYLLPDCLKPQYDGMTLWEFAGMILSLANDKGDEVEAMAQVLGEKPDTDSNNFRESH